MSSVQPSSSPIDRESWHEFAACAGEVSALFYPPMSSEMRRAKRAREARAKAICAVCPVQRHCLEHALANDERYGIWGGLTDRERRLERH